MQAGTGARPVGSESGSATPWCASEVLQPSLSSSPSRTSRGPACSLALSSPLCRPLRASPATCAQSYILRVCFFFFSKKKKKKQTNRDICIEMFYSELLLMECSEVEPGEGAGEAAAAAAKRGRGGRAWACRLTPPPFPAGHRLARGAADVNTALLKTSPGSGENGGRKKKGEEKRENMRL